MRKSVALCAIFLTATMLGLCARLPWSRAVEPAADKSAAVDQGRDPFGPVSSPDKPSAAAPAGGETTPRPEHKPVRKSRIKKGAAVDDAALHGAGETLNTSRRGADTASPRPSGPATMKITVGKASGPSAMAELAASEEMIEKTLLRPVTLDVAETPLGKVVDELARQLDVNVMVDRKALNDLGIDPAAPVTCKLTGLPLRFALDELLRPLELTWIIRSGALVVTSPEEADTALTTKVYDVSTILANIPDYPAGRSGDLGDPSPLFGPPAESYEFGGISGFASGSPMFYSCGGASAGATPGAGGMMNITGQSPAQPVLPQRAAAGMGGGQGNCGQQASRGHNSPLDFDTLVDSITSIIQPTTWDSVGGPGSIAPLASQQLLVVRQTQDIHDQVANYLETLRRHVETRPQIRIEAHWLWLTEPELASLQGDQDKAGPEAGDVVSEAAWKKLRQEKRDDADNAAGDMVEMNAFEAILKGQNGQLISGVSGRQTRVMVTLIPVVGAPPVTGGGGGMGGMEPVSAPPQTPSCPPCVRTLLTEPPGVGYQPICRTIQEGGALEVRPCVVAEGKEILLDLHSRFVQREDNPDAKPQTPVPGVASGANTGVVGSTAGADSPTARPSANMVQAVAAAVDRPVIHHYRLESTLRVPAGKRVLVGGLTYGDPSADETNLYLFVKATVVSGAVQGNH